MRADRLVSLVLLLQARDQLLAAAHGILGRYGTGPRRTEPWLTARSAPNHNFRT